MGEMEEDPALREREELQGRDEEGEMVLVKLLKKEQKKEETEIKKKSKES